MSFIFIKTAAKIRGRQLRKLREFFAKNPEWVGHSSRDIAPIIKDETLLSPWRMLFKKKKKMPEMEEYSGKEHPLIKFFLYPTQVSSMHKKIIRAPKKSNNPLLDALDLMGTYGKGGVLFKAPKKMGRNALIASIPERILAGKIKVPKKTSIFIASNKDINKLRRKHKDAIILSREAFEKRFPKAVAEDITG